MYVCVCVCDNTFVYMHTLFFKFVKTLPRKISKK